MLQIPSINLKINCMQFAQVTIMLLQFQLNLIYFNKSIKFYANKVGGFLRCSSAVRDKIYLKKCCRVNV